jgi:hypothetical protein
MRPHSRIRTKARHRIRIVEIQIRQAVHPGSTLGHLQDRWLAGKAGPLLVSGGSEGIQSGGKAGRGHGMGSKVHLDAHYFTN